jgi:hypothetical protein
MSITTLVKAKKLSKKYMQKKSRIEAKTNHNQEKRKPIFFKKMTVKTLIPRNNQAM